MNMLLRLHSLVRCVRVKSSFLQCSIESTLNLENMHFQFLMEVSSSMEFLGHPLSLDRSMSGNGSWWSQFYNGWTSSMMSPHHSMEFDKSERLKSMDVWFSCFWDLVERKGNFIYLYYFVKNTKPGKNRKKLYYHCQCAESLQPSMLCISQIQRLTQPPQRRCWKSPPRCTGTLKQKEEQKFCQCPFQFNIAHRRQLMPTKCKKNIYFYHYWSQFGCHTVFIR